MGHAALVTYRDQCVPFSVSVWNDLRFRYFFTIVSRRFQIVFGAQALGHFHLSPEIGFTLGRVSG